MSLGPTERCMFCKSRYYLEKLREHEALCSSRPGRFTVRDAVRIAIDSNPAASTNRALLVMLVWRLKDGYCCNGAPRDRLTDPERITRELRRLRKNMSIRRRPSQGH